MPPPRVFTAMPAFDDIRTISATSSLERGFTTASGISPGCSEKSSEKKRRSSGDVSTRSSPTMAARRLAKSLDNTSATRLIHSLLRRPV
jgi:hypothetical protein